MDVRCERCNTEYEFDDALVSGRGTTVKCTNCGHKFKIRRQDGDYSEDFWNVRTDDGRTLVFTSLRELQRAIQSGLVGRSDMLSRGGLPPKAIGQIPELAPFFESRDGGKGLPRAPASDPSLVAAGMAGSVPAQLTRRATSRPPPPPGAVVPQLAAPMRRQHTTRPDFPPMEEPPGAYAAPVDAAPVEAPTPLAPNGPSAYADTALNHGAPSAPSVDPRAPLKRTLIGPGPEPPSATMRARMGSVPPPAPDTERVERAPEPASPETQRIARAENVNVHVHVHAPPEVDASSPLPPPSPRVIRTMRVIDDAGDAADGRSPSIPEPVSFGRRRSVGGFIVAVVVLAGVGLLGAVWARDHLGVLPGASPPAPTVDPRVATFLSTGEKALADGNLDLAKEDFDKASALAEKDPHVLVDVARLAAIRADTAWLKERLLAPDAADERRVTQAELAERAQAAMKAANDAIAAAPDDPNAVRAKVDALRISGDPDAARALVSKVASTSSVPETSYVLAALDLAAPSPPWAQIVGRLRTAAGAESGPGRARAALAYALARSGDVAGSKAEVERLATMARQHPLLPLLRAFAERAAPTAADAGAPDAGRVAAVEEPHAKHETGGGRPSGDPRNLVARAERARASGDLETAQTLYAAALDRNPTDTEALSGLAAIAHAHHDLPGARASYKRVLSINPSYVPALVGLGDVDWESGDRASAMKTYKEVVDRFPEGSYPPRVKQRLEAGAPRAPAPTGTEPGGG